MESQKIRRPRATREQMVERRNIVISSLEVEPRSIYELADLVQLSYPQTVSMLKSLEDEGRIQRVGRENRKLIYRIGSDKLIATPVFADTNIVNINNANYINASYLLDMISEDNPEEFVRFLEGLV